MQLFQYYTDIGHKDCNFLSVSSPNFSFFGNGGRLVIGYEPFKWGVGKIQRLLVLGGFVFCGCVNMIIPFLTLKQIKGKEADTSFKRFSSRVCGKSENEITENLNSCSLSHNNIWLWLYNFVFLVLSVAGF